MLRTNGKARRIIKTPLEEWTYAMRYSTSADGNELLHAYLRIYKDRRGNMALGVHAPAPPPPQQRHTQLQE